MSLTVSTPEILIALFGLYGTIATIQLVRFSNRDFRKEKLIDKLNQKVLDYRIAVSDLNKVVRTEKHDDHLV